jgi:hypothetical protein
MEPIAGFEPAAGKGKSPGFPSKNARSENRRKFFRRNGQRGYGEFSPSIDRKKGRFLGLFCR